MLLRKDEQIDRLQQGKSRVSHGGMVGREGENRCSLGRMNR